MSAFAQPFSFTPRSSRLLSAYILAVHLIACLLLIPLNIALWVKLLLTMMIMLSFIISWRHYISWAVNNHIQEVIWRLDGQWLLLTSQGELDDVELLPDSFIHTWLVILHFKHTQGRSYVLLLPGMIDVDDFRRLRVRLKMSGVEADGQTV